MVRVSLSFYYRNDLINFYDFNNLNCDLYVQSIHVKHFNTEMLGKIIIQYKY